MYEDYVPNPRIIARAIELWKRALGKPKYDALGDHGTPEECFRMGMASTMASMLPNNATPELLDAFGEHLAKAISTPKEDGKYHWDQQSLHVDYHPDCILDDAAKAAGLKMEFPWKSSMHIHSTYLSFAVGYGAERLCHYPLSGDRWLVTTLCGSDISKLIDAIEAGEPIPLTIELP